MEIKIEFQNINVSQEDNNDLKALLKGSDIALSVRSTKSLSGVMTLIIAISGRVIGDYLLRLFKHLEDKYKSKYVIQVKDENSGETLSLDEAKEKLIEKE